MMTPRPLPNEAKKLCDLLAAPPLLVAHLTLVHDGAADLLDSLGKEFPLLEVHREAVLFGAATHDLGKVLHPTAEGGRDAEPPFEPTPDPLPPHPLTVLARDRRRHFPGSAPCSPARGRSRSP